MRIVQTEQYRNAPIYKNELFSLSWEPASAHTKLINWRGGTIEFAKGCREDIAAEPWWGIKIQHHKNTKPYIWWLDYCGPPHLYLTKKGANKKAKELKEQYKPYSIKVVHIGEVKTK